MPAERIRRIGVLDVVAQSVCLDPRSEFRRNFLSASCFAKRAGSRVCKITDVRIDQLPPCQGSRTSLRRSHRSRKENQPGFRRLCSERYPYQ
jgi:hypothetical protein